MSGRGKYPRNFQELIKRECDVSYVRYLIRIRGSSLLIQQKKHIVQFIKTRLNLSPVEVIKIFWIKLTVECRQ